jgi:hypothetical protein
MISDQWRHRFCSDGILLSGKHQTGPEITKNRKEKAVFKQPAQVNEVRFSEIHRENLPRYPRECAGKETRAAGGATSKKIR